MSLPGRVFRAGVMPLLETLLGRRNTVRLGRAISMEARLDAANDMAHNGELMVQERVLGAIPSDRKIVALDVGANKGEWTRSLLAKAGARPIEVHLFEPASATYGELIGLMREDSGRTRLVNEALSEKKGTAAFFCDGRRAGNEFTPRRRCRCGIH